jgi:hypothetical protein
MAGSGLSEKEEYWQLSLIIARLVEISGAGRMIPVEAPGLANTAYSLFKEPNKCLPGGCFIFAAAVKAR